MINVCTDPTHGCEGCYAFPYGWTIAEVKPQQSYLRVTFNEGVTVYVHQAAGYANYYFRKDAGPGMPESATAIRRAHEFLRGHPEGRLLPNEEAKDRAVVQVRLAAAHGGTVRSRPEEGMRIHDDEDFILALEYAPDDYATFDPNKTGRWRTYGKNGHLLGVIWLDDAQEGTGFLGGDEELAPGTNAVAGVMLTRFRAMKQQGVRASAAYEAVQEDPGAELSEEHTGQLILAIQRAHWLHDREGPLWAAFHPETEQFIALLWERHNGIYRWRRWGPWLTPSDYTDHIYEATQRIRITNTGMAYAESVLWQDRTLTRAALDPYRLDADTGEPCPHCGQYTVTPILYGTPGPNAVEAARRGKVVLTGRVVSEGDGAKSCSNCGSTWAESQDMTASAISEKFAAYFANWNIELPPGSEAAKARGSINKKGWRIRYVFGYDGESFIEFYATHRMTNDRRHRIYESGKVESLESIQTMYKHDPAVAGSKQEAEQIYRERNQRIADELRSLGLYPEGDINAFLRTNDVPPRGRG